MNRASFMGSAQAVLLAGLAGLSLAGFAQDTAKKPPPRLPPTGSQSTDIPAGVDTGTPTTSKGMPLGTPVPPAMAADRGDQNKRSAAARAAARPASSARSRDTVPAGPAVLGAETSRTDPMADVPAGQRPRAKKRASP
ncbi:MAG: hypothetical protein ABI699_18050 [Caldimonas sp.]